MLLDLICKELGVEVGEEFSLKPAGGREQVFRLNKTYGLEVYNEAAGLWVATGNHIYRDLLTGRIKPVWKPAKGEVYYIPEFYMMNTNDLIALYWAGDKIDMWYFENNLVFKTKDEAIDCANKMLEVVKEG